MKAPSGKLDWREEQLWRDINRSTVRKRVREIYLFARQRLTSGEEKMHKKTRMHKQKSNIVMFFHLCTSLKMYINAVFST